MRYLEPLLFPVAIFVVLYVAYFIWRNKIKENKTYAVLINSISIVLCLILLFDAIKRERSSFILFLLLLLGIAGKKLIDQTKKST